MIKVTVKIDGMMCGMCEAHVCAALRRVFPDAKKVKASRKHGEATFLVENAIDESAVQKAITDIGYTYVSATVEPYIKRRFFA